MSAVSAHKKELDDLEKSMEMIRRDFDQYFMGMARRAPTTAQAQLAGVMRKIKEEQLKDWNTQDRFRFNQIHARFVSMERMWARTLKQIEDGTYKRDKFKVAQMKRREAQLAKAATQLGGDPQATLDARGPVDLDGFDVDVGGFEDDFDAPSGSRPAAGPPRQAPASAAATTTAARNGAPLAAAPGANRPATAPSPGAPSPGAPSPGAPSPGAPSPGAPAHRPAPAAAAAAAQRPAGGSSGGDLGGLSEARLQQLHKVYVDAKRRTGEASSLTLEALRAQVAKQVPVIREKHGCAQVDFKVVLKDGKAMLKAIPK
jgi:hypothetical protein